MVGLKTDKMKAKFKESFKRYMDAPKDQNDCKEPCLKNGKSDRYCLECANHIMQPIINPPETPD